MTRRTDLVVLRVLALALAWHLGNVVHPADADAGPHVLTIQVRDLATGQPLSARVGVFDGLLPIAPADLEAHMFQDLNRKSYFYCDGAVSLLVPGALLTIEVGHGFEYEPQRLQFVVGSDTTVAVDLLRFSDMNALGWFSADTHVHIAHAPLTYHLDSSHLRLALDAEDLNFINSMDLPAHFTGEVDSVSTPERIIYFSEEMRNAHFGHLTTVGLKEWVDVPKCGIPLVACGDPLNGLLYRQVHGQGAGVAVIATHPFSTFDIMDISVWPGQGVWRGMPIDLAGETIDAMDLLSYSHNVVALEVAEPYFHALNAGFHLPPAAGTDATLGRARTLPPGGFRMYVSPPGPGVFTVARFVEALRAGRSFVTNYPLFERFEIDGAVPGEVVGYDGQALPGSLSVKCILPFTNVELIGNSGVLASFTPPGGEAREFATSFSVDPEGLTWVVARVTGSPWSWHMVTTGGLFAQTAPVYLERWPSGDNNPHRRRIGWTAAPTAPGRVAVEYFLDYLDEVEHFFDIYGDFPDSTGAAEFDSAMCAARIHYHGLIPDPPEPFAILEPLGEGGVPVVGTTTPRFVWEEAIDPDPGDSVVYRLSVDADRQFTAPLVIDGLTITEHRLSPGHALLDGTLYYWRVEAIDDLGLVRAATPDPCSLLVWTAGTAVPRVRPPARWVIHSISPNPFSGVLRVAYGVPEGGGRFTLEVFDPLGRRVRTLFAGRRPPGVFDVNWDGTDDRGRRVASGVYFVRLNPAGAAPAVVRKAIRVK